MERPQENAQAAAQPHAADQAQSAAQPQQPEQQPQPPQMPPQADPNTTQLDSNALPQPMGLDPNFANLDPNAVPGLLPNSLFPDPSLAAMGMADPSIMVPLMTPNGAAAQPPKAISADDIALYDRQIRLWGVDAQARIQNANVLLVNIRGLANEIAKNLVLAGIASLTLLDSATVTQADLGCEFFVAEDDDPVGQKRAEVASANIRKLNPRVQIHVDTEGVSAKVPTYFAAYDVVIATDLAPTAFNLINIATRLNNKPFYAAGTHGMYGFIFSDLIEHTYVVERDVGNRATEVKPETRTRSVVDVATRKEGPKQVESVTKSELYSTWFLSADFGNLPAELLRSKRRLRHVTPALSCLRALWEFTQLRDGRLPQDREDLKLFTQLATQKHKALRLPPETLSSEFLRGFLQNLGSEIAPVAAILGGQLAQDVINVLGRKQQPIQNLVVLDGTTMEAAMYPLHPEGVLGATQSQLPVGDPAPSAGGGAAATGPASAMDLQGGGGGMGMNGMLGGGGGGADIVGMGDPSAMAMGGAGLGFPMSGGFGAGMVMGGQMALNQDGTFAVPGVPDAPVQEADAAGAAEAGGAQVEKGEAAATTQGEKRKREDEAVQP